MSRRFPGWRACWSGARSSCAGRTEGSCCARPWAQHAREAGRSACTPIARSCRTTRTARSCGDRRRTSRSGCRLGSAATTGCRTARSGRLRAPPSGSASSVRRHPAADGPAPGPASADAAAPVPWDRAASLRPDNRAVGISDRSSLRDYITLPAGWQTFPAGRLGSRTNVRGSAFGVLRSGSGFEVRGSGFEVRGSAFLVHGSSPRR
jgi:hypothetical protein